MSNEDTSDAMLMLSRLVQASSRWVLELHKSGKVTDRGEELAHILANLDGVEKLLGEAKK